MPTRWTRHTTITAPKACLTPVCQQVSLHCVCLVTMTSSQQRFYANQHTHLFENYQKFMSLQKELHNLHCQQITGEHIFTKECSSCYVYLGFVLFIFCCFTKSNNDKELVDILTYHVPCIFSAAPPMSGRVGYTPQPMYASEQSPMVPTQPNPRPNFNNM